MLKEIDLNTKLYDSNIVTLAENDNLQITIKGKVYTNATYYLKAKNGVNLINLKFIDRFIEIPRKTLNYGEFVAKIVVIVDEVVVKEFDIEKLYIKEIDGEFKLIPELEQVKSEFLQIKNENDRLVRKIAELEKLCEDTKELVLQLYGLTQKVGE